MTKLAWGSMNFRLRSRTHAHNLRRVFTSVAVRHDLLLLAQRRYHTALPWRT
jgi:hypothetical protein